MTSSTMGADLIVNTLEESDVKVIFGIPGSHDTYLYNALRRSSIRVVSTTNELHAAFMANGYYRSSGNLGVMTAIAGPGFTNAISGLAEAFLDSAGMICIICKPSDLPGNEFQLQNIDEKEMARTVTKGHFSVESGTQIVPTLKACMDLASTGEPGPVLLEIASGLLPEKRSFAETEKTPFELRPSTIEESVVESVVNLMTTSRRLILYLGQGVLNATDQALKLVELLKSPVLTTTSARGIIPETHPMSLPSDLVDDVEFVNTILDSCDIILALGCKFTHNGSKGFQLNFPEEKLIHIDASPEVLEANYPARIAIPADASEFISAVLRHHKTLLSRDIGWKPGEIEHWRKSLIKRKHKKTFSEPLFDGLKQPTAKAFFSLLKETLPETSCLITDSGLHQMLTRKYWDVSMPRGLIIPTDFQSMGFGIPAAIGARLAVPEKPVVAVVGDGGFALSGMELATAAREHIDLTVILFNDHNMGLIRLHQLGKLGQSYAVKTGEIDYAKFCDSLGIQYRKLKDNPHEALQMSLEHDGVSLIEVDLKDSLDIQKTSAKGFLRNLLKI